MAATDAESEVVFGRAGLLLFGPWFGVSPAVSTWRAMLKTVLALHPGWEEPSDA